MSEFHTNDETRYRFDRDDLVQQLLEGDVIGSYRWRPAYAFTIDPDVEVGFGGTSYEYVDEDTEITLVHGDLPYGVREGGRLSWYEETGGFSDLALVLDPDGVVLGGIVQEPEDDEDADDFEPAAAAAVSPATLTSLATESAGRPLVPVVLVLIVVVGLVAFLLTTG